MSNWRKIQPDLWELLAADKEFMEYLNTLRPRSYHEAVAVRLESLVEGADEILNPAQFYKDQYRRDAAELYRRNLLSLSKV